MFLPSLFGCVVAIAVYTYLEHFYVGPAPSFMVKLGLSDDVLKANEEGHTAVAIAILADEHTPKIERLLLKGSNISAVDIQGNSLMHLAAMVGRIKVIDLLAERGMGFEVTNKGGETPLIVACRYSNSDTALHLIGRKADYTRADSEGMTPLFHSAGRGLVDVARELFNLGVSATDYDTNGRTPLMVSSMMGQIDMIDLLLKMGADVEEVHEDTYSNALHMAVRYDHGDATVDVVKLLLTQNPDLEERNGEGHTPLMAAAISGNVPAIKVLIAAGADLEASDEAEGLTSLILASMKLQANAVEVLVEAGANLFATTDNKMQAAGYVLKIATDQQYPDDIRSRADDILEYLRRASKGEK